MKSLTVRIPEALFAELSAEAQANGKSVSEIVRHRLEQAGPPKPALIDEFDDLEAFALMSQLLGLGHEEAPPAEPVPASTGHTEPHDEETPAPPKAKRRSSKKTTPAKHETPDLALWSAQSEPSEP